MSKLKNDHIVIYLSFFKIILLFFRHLSFDIPLTFELWYLKLKVQYFLIAASYLGTNDGHVLWEWILYSSSIPC